MLDDIKSDNDIDINFDDINIIIKGLAKINQLEQSIYIYNDWRKIKNPNLKTLNVLIHYYIDNYLLVCNIFNDMINKYNIIPNYRTLLNLIKADLYNYKMNEAINKLYLIDKYKFIVDEQIFNILLNGNIRLDNSEYSQQILDKMIN